MYYHLRNFRHNLVVSLLTVVLCFGVSVTSAYAQGTVSGTVTDTKGEPLPFANVLVEGTSIGSATDVSGKFSIANIPAGQYVLKVLYLGYEEQSRTVQVTDGGVVTANFKLAETVVGTVETVKIVGKRELIKRETSASFHSVGQEELERLPVDTFAEAVALKSGVVAQGDQLHFRGGRAGEVQYQIDGIPVNDPLVGGTVDVATVAVSDSEILLGGFDAEHGNAQSGVVNIITQEGGDHFSGELSYMTDDYGAPDKTFNNYDRISLGFGGPTMVDNLNYYVSVQGTWADTYLRTSERRERSTFLDFIRLGERQSNNVQFQTKLSWKPGPNYKMTFEVINQSTRRDSYSHIFSRDGFVETEVDTLFDTGEIRTLYGDFSERQEGPEWVYFNGPENTPNFENDFRQFKVVWNHTLSEGTLYTMKLSSHRFTSLTSVQDQYPWEYEGRYPDQWRDRINFETEPFFATNGDIPTYSERDTKVWTLKSDWTSKIGRHQMKTGFEFTYNDLELFSVNFPNRTGPDGQIGLTRSEYHYFNPEGSFYLQDRWEHEGMVLNAGLRYDLFSVGDQLDASEVETRIRDQWSPRVGIAYPISDRDVFSFHYGRFSQVPDRRFIFEDRTGSVAVRGNPNLENETTVAYQAALQHMFSPNVFGQFSVYFKDIFGLLSVQEVSSGDSPALVDQYVNRDYASSRGFEVSLTKRFSNNFAGELSYTYGIASGVASDPNQQQNVDFLYLPISEQPLDWDQRHTISATLSIAEVNKWAANLVWSLGTGFPWTPRERDTRQTDPLLTNSRRLPSTSNLTLQGEKYYRIWGQRVKVFARGTNLLDARNIRDLEPSNWPGPPQASAFDYRVFYTETGRAGGAYLDEDVNEDGIRDWIALNDPRVFSEGRSIRMGVGISF
ncbi:MAG: TonB-dependent receptor [Candidatus Eisenbacteria bacterium]|uniref:TonB-dependent receptor n=1 Tax=Eiseniibacteriota bacterium TaxID=2212470 RepID=A0A7Y2E6N5_UNCEI|nr:TonB-dependent receptor [Candidatus Eisenbacteria bacterium]